MKLAVLLVSLLFLATTPMIEAKKTPNDPDKPNKPAKHKPTPKPKPKSKWCKKNEKRCEDFLDDPDKKCKDFCKGKKGKKFKKCNKTCNKCKKKCM